MTTYAVIKTGGKQYRVSPGDYLNVEKLPVSTGDIIKIDNVHLVANGNDVLIGTPNVDGASVTARVLENGRGKKIVIIKFKRRKGFSTKNGHRQSYTKIEIINIEFNGNIYDTIPEKKKTITSKKTTNNQSKKFKPKSKQKLKADSNLPPVIAQNEMSKLAEIEVPIVSDEPLSLPENDLSVNIAEHESPASENISAATFECTPLVDVAELSQGQDTQAVLGEFESNSTSLPPVEQDDTRSDIGTEKSIEIEKNSVTDVLRKSISDPLHKILEIRRPAGNTNKNFNQQEKWIILAIIAAVLLLLLYIFIPVAGNNTTKTIIDEPISEETEITTEVQVQEKITKTVEVPVQEKAKTTVDVQIQEKAKTTVDLQIQEKAKTTVEVPVQEKAKTTVDVQIQEKTKTTVEVPDQEETIKTPESVVEPMPVHTEDTMEKAPIAHDIKVEEAQPASAPSAPQLAPQ